MDHQQHHPGQHHPSLHHSSSLFEGVDPHIGVLTFYSHIANNNGSGRDSLSFSRQGGAELTRWSGAGDADLESMSGTFAVIHDGTAIAVHWSKLDLGSHVTSNMATSEDVLPLINGGRTIVYRNVEYSRRV